MRLKTFAAPVAALALCAVPAVHFATPPHDPPRGPYQVPLLPRLEFLKVIGAGQGPLITDYFWLQAIQAAGRGGQSLERTRWLDLYYYSDLVTDLDPKFKKVYVYAGTAIPTNIGRETYVNVDEGMAILKKGMTTFPDDWEIGFYYGVNLSYLKKQHHEAAQVLARVARLPGAPHYVDEIASRLLAVEGDFNAAFALVDAAAETATDPKVKKTFEERRTEIAQEAVLQKVDHAIQAFQQDHGGELPKGGLSELQDEHYLDEVPPDPMRGIIYIGTDGRAYSTAAEERFVAVDADYRRHQKYGDDK